jgi:cupin 2 domain-containing protein
MTAHSETIAGNVFHDLGTCSQSEVFLRMFESQGVRIERIVSTGQVTPEGQWLDQAWTEWVLVLRGRAEILLENEASPRRLGTGDWLEIGQHVRHRVVYTDTAEPTVWLAIHCGLKAL